MNASEIFKAKADGLLEIAAELHTEANRYLRMAKWVDDVAIPDANRYDSDGYATPDDFAEIAAEPYRRTVVVFPLQRLNSTQPAGNL